jgi:hypothetical protein
MFVSRKSFHFRKDFVLVATGNYIPLGLATALTGPGRMD